MQSKIRVYESGRTEQVMRLRSLCIFGLGESLLWFSIEYLASMLKLFYQKKSFIAFISPGV